MSLFDKAIKEVLLNEGVGTNPRNPTGWVNDKYDTGGMTNYGITYKTYAKFLGKLPFQISENEMRNMPYGNVLRIYKELYWDKIQGDKIKRFPIAYAMLDFSINKGPHRVIPMIQSILGGVPIQANMRESEIVINNETIKKINSLNKEQTRQLLAVFFDKLDDQYYSIVQNNGTQKRFLAGWLNRVSKAREFSDINFALINARTVGLTMGISAIIVSMAVLARRMNT